MYYSITEVGRVCDASISIPMTATVCVISSTWTSGVRGDTFPGKLLVALLAYPHPRLLCVVKSHTHSELTAVSNRTQQI